jgi:xylulokinase
MDPESKGAIIGLTLQTSSGQFYRALMEGVTYEMKYNLECLEKAGIRVEGLRAVGGGAKSDLWMQIKADITGKTVETLCINEAGTMATAILAGAAAGVYGSCKEAVKKLIRVKKVFYPNPKAYEIYQDNYHRYKKTYSQIKGIYADN